MMVVLLHSNGQLRTERDGDTEKGCQKPAVQQKTTDDGDNQAVLKVSISQLNLPHKIKQKLKNKH